MHQAGDIAPDPVLWTMHRNRTIQLWGANEQLHQQRRNQSHSSSTTRAKWNIIQHLLISLLHRTCYCKPNVIDMSWPPWAGVQREPINFLWQFICSFEFVLFSRSEWVNKQVKTDDRIPIAFDMEWPFTFQTGPGKSAVIQLCLDIDLCYVFHIAELKKLPASLVLLLTHDAVCLHGVNVKK